MDYPFDPKMGEAIGGIMGASSTLKDADWNNSTVIGPYRRETIQELKDRVEGGLYVSGSAQLARAEAYDNGVVHLALAYRTTA